ncbi:MAG: ATP-binding protein [bacterium]
MKIKRSIIEINEELCNGCGQCVEACSEGAIELANGKAHLVAEKYCDGLGACLGECPQNAIKMYEREAEDFDPEAVEEHLKKKENSTLACGCPSTHIREFSSATSCNEEHQPISQHSVVSALTHWPVQIRLIPATAPFLKNSRLLIAADCTLVSIPNFHQEFLKGRVIMIGCPKFDDKEAYIQKFADIFSTAHIKDITVLVMEVPCCNGLPYIVKKGMEIAGKNIPLKQIIKKIGIDT